MVRPPKVSELKQPPNFRKVSKKTSIKNPEIEEKYRSQASYPTTANKKVITPISCKKTPEVTTPPKVTIQLGKRSSHSISSRSLAKKLVLPETKDGERVYSTFRPQKSRGTQGKNKMPAVAKSEPMNRRMVDKEGKKQKHKGKNIGPQPPPESYFKPEGKFRSSSQPNKVVGRLITPKLVEERCEKVEQELKNRLGTNKVEHSNVSLMTHYCAGLKSEHMIEKKPVKFVRKIRKSKIPSKKNKISPSKTTLKKKSDSENKIDRKSKKSDTNLKPCSSDERPTVREIKHNDSFVISAKKLQNSIKVKRTKPEIIRLYKRRDVNKVVCDNNPLRSCLKKNPDGNPKQSFGEHLSKVSLSIPLKKNNKRSQIPRWSKEKISIVK